MDDGKDWVDAAEVSFVVGPEASRMSTASGRPTLSRSKGRRPPGFGAVELRMRGSGPMVECDVDVDVLVDVLMRTGEGAAAMLVLGRGVGVVASPVDAGVADLRRFSQRMMTNKAKEWGGREEGKAADRRRTVVL